MIFKYPFGIIGIFLLIQSAVSYSLWKKSIKRKDDLRAKFSRCEINLSGPPDLYPVLTSLYHFV